MRRRFFTPQKKQIDTSNYMTIVALEDGLTAKISDRAYQYCVDGDGNWIDLPAATATQAINKGQKLSFRGEMPQSAAGIGTFTISKFCNLEGNCMSLIFGDNANSNNSLPNISYIFQSLFSRCQTIIEISNTFLPATTLSIGCYEYMFEFCTNLVKGPELPAGTLQIFSYRAMFMGCSNLNYIKMLATNISAIDAMKSWVMGVASSGTFVKNKDATWDVVGNSGIPEGWTVITDDQENTSVISFTIGDVSYQAEQGMTWGEWVASDFNTGGFYVDIDGSIAADLFSGWIGTDDYYVFENESIIADYDYLLVG